MSKRTLFVCGDSFMSPIVNNTDPKLYHFSELMPKEIFQTAYPLAQNGSSNFGICLQLETALKYSAGFVLLNTTSVDRLDIPLVTTMTTY